MVRLHLVAAVFTCIVGLVSDIEVPRPPKPDTPPPAPAGEVMTITGDSLYVINCKVECLVRAHPAGLVKITQEAGPVRIRGKFVGGTGKTETRSYAGPYVYILEATGTGKAEVDIIPFGFKSEADIVGVRVNVDAGEGPRPPPQPPGPTPNPPAPEPDKVTNPFGETTGLRVLFIINTEKLTEDQFSAVFGKDTRDLLNAKCPLGPDGRTREWRIYPAGTDVSSDTEPWKSTFTKYNDKTTKVIIGSGKKGEVKALTNPADTAALINKYGG